MNRLSSFVSFQLWKMTLSVLNNSKAICLRPAAVCVSSFVLIQSYQNNLLVMVRTVQRDTTCGIFYTE